jgi:hypothetical protein
MIARRIAVVAAALAASAAHAAPGLDPDVRKAGIEGVVRRIRAAYVFPDVGERMAKHVTEQAAQGAYEKLADGEAVAAALTRDLRSVSNDRHVRVMYSAEVLPPEPSGAGKPDAEAMEAMRRQAARENFGLAKLDILKGNVGYLDFHLLTPPALAGDTYVAAMNYLANTDALIIDLRRCRGAVSPDAIPLLCSYFFAEPVHLNDLYWRPDDSTRQLWTLPHVPGKRYLNKPIYVLTSRATFSGAEELAYDLQNLKRATIIGEVTGGGAHAGGTQRASDHFTVWVPFGRAINPITKTNWEGVGVKPDVEVSPVLALHRAHLTALRQIAETTTDPRWREHLGRLKTEVEREAPVLRKVTFRLPGHPDAGEVFVAGTFNNWAPGRHPLTRRGDAWTVEAEVVPGRVEYKFIVDGRWMLDPANPERTAAGEFENSVRLVR